MPSPSFDILKVVRALADHIYQEEDFRLIMSGIDVSKGLIDLDGAPLHVWHRIVMYCKDNEIIKRLFEVIIQLHQIPALIRILSEEVPDLGVGGERKKIFSSISDSIDINKLRPDIKRVDCNRSQAFKKYEIEIDEPSGFLMTYLLGNIPDNTDNFAERLTLEYKEYTSYFNNKNRGFWAYRSNDNNNRYDDIPFSIKPTLKKSQFYFCRCFEQLHGSLPFKELISNIPKQFGNISITLRYDFRIGKDILRDFSQWLVDEFSSIHDLEVAFYLAFINVGDKNEREDNISYIEEQARRIEEVHVPVIKCFEKTNKNDIQAWIKSIGANPEYVNNDFINDLQACGVSIDAINSFKNKGELYMSQIELFQERLYQEIIK